ncbi:hypothetical protein LNKW23_25560 [Paralimibaculum aggregatum]|uniref:Cell envelope biogenesis protein TolA n=1 Tax=Paralimibaculum aggregatum TaxID=3036245 RepID=A0ABQ6LJ97_9RHOB|nr:hypothetical protein [Limibaculum sp. NKW23]GMG83343.1 hypothetical protein LNKW23_25560 [Limibaculum sp. NKW23]
MRRARRQAAGKTGTEADLVETGAGGMREGLIASGALHLGLLLAVLVGPLFAAREEPAQFITAEVSVIDGADFDAMLSAAPVRPSDAPDGPVAPELAETPPLQPAPPAETAPERGELGPVAAAPPDPRPDLPVLASPPPPTTVPTEAVRPSIAEIPVPDAPPAEAPVPESPPATEPVQPLASRPVPVPGARPERPPDPEPAPAEAEAPEPEPDETETPEAEVAQEPEAPEGPAPREARLPVARPAEVAAASAASQETRQAAATPEPSPEPAPEPAARQAAEPTPPRAAGASRFASQVSRGEKDALRLGIQQYFTYAGSRADRSLEVTVAIALDPAGSIVEGPELVEARGGDQGAQRALFQAGRRALIRAASQGRVFAKLPREKFSAWQRIHVTFTPHGAGFSS